MWRVELRRSGFRGSNDGLMGQIKLADGAAPDSRLFRVVDTFFEAKRIIDHGVN